MRSLQEVLLKIYEIFQKTGLLETSWFKRLFLNCYFLYKKYLEDPFYGLSKQRKDIFQDGYILDVGSNIGYTSLVFSKVVTSGFAVYSFEPDLSNFKTLQDVIKNYRLSKKVIPVHAAVGNQCGTIDFWHNKRHSGDHRVLTDEYRKICADLDEVYTVQLWSVDEFVESENIQASIKLIKIDVQGYELPVCQGMEKTLSANPNLVVAIEYAPASLHDLGFKPEHLLDFFRDRNYLLYLLFQDGRLTVASDEAIAKMVEKRGYADLLCSKQRLL